MTYFGLIHNWQKENLLNISSNNNDETGFIQVDKLNLMDESQAQQPINYKECDLGT